MVFNPVFWIAFVIFFILCVIYGLYAGSTASAHFIPRGLGTEPNTETSLPKVLQHQAATLNIILDLIPEANKNG